MEQQGIMVFEKGLDEFLSDLKLRLTRSESVHVTSQSMPQSFTLTTNPAR